MQKDELVAVAQSLQMADGSLDAFVGEQTIPRRQQAIVTACCPVVDADAVAHEVCRRIAEVVQTLREGDDVRGQWNGEFVIEDLTAMRIHSRLDRRQGRIGIL